MSISRTSLAVILTAATIATTAIVGFGGDPAHAAAASLTSGAYTLNLESTGANSYGVAITKAGNRLDEQPKPLIIRIKNSSGTEDAYQTAYTAVSAGSGSGSGTVTATGTVTTAAGSAFEVTDSYRVQDSNSAFRMDRTVRVATAKAADRGFASRYALTPTASTALTDYDMFAPGNWYKKNANVVPGAIASNYNDENFLIKETRLPLPLTAMRTVSSGESLALIHADATPSSTTSESSESWLVDKDFDFGSIGVTKSPRPALTFVYPSTEGDRNYYGNDQAGSLQRTGQVRRSNPVTAGYTQKYSLVLKLSQSSTFPGTQGDVWKYAFGLYAPKPTFIDAQTLYDNDITYYLAKFKDFGNGVAGLPWSSYTRTGGDTGYHMASGFVGQQTKVGWQLVREGFRSGNATALKDGNAMVDFWANQSMNASGIPRTDYFAPEGNWLKDPVFLRTTSDAAEGVLDAYDTAYKNGAIHDNWLTYAQKYGDFLVQKQAADGSWARSYNQDGTPSQTGKFNTTNPIRFLVKLALATHDDRYRDAATKAGAWSLTNVDAASAYVGGTPDNANTIDKEAGMMALNGFNSLYDLTGESRWLTAAKNAANYVESWTFSYNYDVYPSTRWAANGATYPSWLQVDLGSTQPIERIETMFEHGEAAYKYRLQTSTDGSTWTTFTDDTNNTAASSGMGYVDNGTATARYVRITVTGAVQSGIWPSIYEFKVYGPAGNDLAVGKPTTASSSQDADHSPGKATDPVATSQAKDPWPNAGLIGQSLVATGHSYTDTFMINGPAEYYRLYVATGDQQYLTFAQILANNANAPADYDGRLGYQYKALLGEGIMANNFTEYYGLETLTWQLAVQLESIATLEDMFGFKNIRDIEANLDTSQKQALNHLAYQPGGQHPVTQVQSGRVYEVVNEGSGKLLDVAGASTANSANVQQWHDINGNGQRWRAIDAGNGSWKLVNIGSGKVLDVEGSSTANGGNISQYSDTGSVNQQWNIVGVGGGYWKILNRNSGKAVDVEASGRNDGRNVSQYSDTGAQNQRWAFIEIP